MSVFTEKELEYFAGQRLGRIATVGPDGQPHVVPTSFRYAPEHDAIEVGGLRMSQTKKVRDAQQAGRAAIVVDDVLPPWQPRMIEMTRRRAPGRSPLPDQTQAKLQPVIPNGSMLRHQAPWSTERARADYSRGNDAWGTADAVGRAGRAGPARAVRRR